MLYYVFFESHSSALKIRNIRGLYMRSEHYDVIIHYGLLIILFFIFFQRYEKSVIDQRGHVENRARVIIRIDRFFIDLEFSESFFVLFSGTIF